MKGIVRQIDGERVLIECRGGDVVHFEPGDSFQPDDLVFWADEPEIFNWTQNTRVRGRWVKE